MENAVALLGGFFLAALLYSSAGLGGGSAYLALLALFQIPFAAIPAIALVCNLLVVSGGLYHYVRTRNLPLRLVLPFALPSVPLAWLGGRTIISKEIFLLLLGFSLLAAGVRMLFAQAPAKRSRPVSGPKIWGLGISAGAGLGFLSGLVGIGGGIFLSPLLYFLGWGNPRQIAASSSFFIFVNSIAGLLGQWAKTPASLPLPELLPFLPLTLAVLLGGQIGSRWSVGKLSFIGLQRVTAVLVTAAACRIFWGFL